MINSKLKKIRKKLDSLDNRLLRLIKIRTELVKRVIKTKSSKKEIVDNKRIKEVLSKVKKNSIKNKIDPVITRKIWSSMINAYIDFEKKNFKKK